MNSTPAYPTPPLAIVGIGCLFPGAADLAGFWLRIVNRFDAIREVPATHWRPDDYLDPDPKAPDHIYAARGAFLDPVAFDSAAFGIPPSNLEATDTSQLLGLLVAQQALQDCGYTGARAIDRSRISVTLGVTGTLQLVIPLGARLGHPLWRRALAEAGVDAATAEDVVQRIADGYVGWQENSFPGLLGNVVAGRIANRFDLGGTNCVVDAACASSLGAIHLASMELASGRADVVLTGGVDTFNDIFMFTCFSKTPALSPTGNARPFDASGDGTVLGEGLGLVVLKRLEDARRDGDRIYAVLRGVGSSSDGRGSAIYAPRKEGQIGALRSAYRVAGVTPDTVELVEAHGTGTRVGDATEVSALAEVYGAAGRQGRWCAVGSIKSQIGHTKAAAGAAGLIKAALSLYHKVLPPTIKVSQPLDVLQAPDCPLYVNTEKRPWLPSDDHPRRAAVSAFGFGGSNFHCVLEEAEPAKREIDWTSEVEILAFSAGSIAELRQQLHAWPLDLAGPELHRRADESRRQFRVEASHRLLLVVEPGTVGQLVAQASRLLESQMPAPQVADNIFLGSGNPPGSLAVLFPGQGAQYVGMQRDLVCHFPQAFDTLVEADRAFCRETGRRLVDLLYPLPAFTPQARAAQEEALKATEVAQPALGAVSLGAWRVLEWFGVRADAYAGHSYGELVALCAAGRLRPEEFFRLSLLRGRLMAEAGRGGAGDPGAMLAVKAGESDITQVLAEEGIDLVLANKNAPQQTVLSGPTALIERAAAAFAARKIGAVRLGVAAAFHSPLVAAAREPFAAALASVEWPAGGGVVYANSTGEKYAEAADAARELLAGQLARPVLWVNTIEAMYAAGVRTFLEVGPGSRLTGLVEAILKGADAGVLAVDASSGQKNGFADLAKVLAWLAARGHAVDLARWHPFTGPAPSQETKKSAITYLSGANYVNPRPARPPRHHAMPTIEPTPTSNGTPESDHRVASAENARKMSQPTPPAPPHPPVEPTALARALEITRENLLALQKMQEQTAQLHRQFLDGQEHAHRTVHLLVEQQQRLLQASLGLPVAAMPVPSPQRPSIEPQAPARVSGAPETPARVETNPSLAPRASAPPSVPLAVPEASRRVEGVLLEVIAEKTGYPGDMLELDMALDADLGIDSIKRVEILSALQERLPDAPSVKPEHLGSLHTLRDIASFLAGSAASAAPARSNGSPVVGQPAGIEKMQHVLLEVIAEKTGYPGDMLELDMALDADLGIDSIKRVEILSALQERLPDAPSVKPEHLGSLHTLRDIASFLAGTATSEPVRQQPSPAPPAVEGLERLIVQPVPLTSAPRKAIDLPARAEVWVTADDPELSQAVAALLSERGLQPRCLSCHELAQHTQSTSVAALILLAPAEGIDDDWLDHALHAVQRAGPGLHHARGALLTVSRLDGSFGLGGGSPRREPVDGGLAGLAKTVAQEWPDVNARALDLAWDLDVRAAAGVIVDELLLTGPTEVGVSASGRVTLECVPKALTSGKHLPFAPAEVVVVSGGARGVTAEVAVALARAFRPTLVLLGRTPEPSAEPGWLASLKDETALKQELSRRHPGTAPRAIGEQVKGVLVAREVRANLERIRQAGANVLYRTVDVRDAAAVAEVIAAVRNEHGPIRGLIHGAGVLADARIEDKTSTQFAAVYGTKVAGLQALLSGIGTDELRALVLFSSSTARFGRTGQSDYAIANEVLNKLAWFEASRRPGCRVVSVNWGPWDGGMVTPGLKKLFAREGIGVIPLDAGAQLLVNELRAGSDGPRELVVLTAGSAAAMQAEPAPEEVTAGPHLAPPLPTAFERVLDVANHPVLADHVLDGRPVLPTVLMLEWLAHAAMVQNPGLVFHGCDGLRILQGVILEGKTPVLRVGAGKAARKDGFFIAPAELRSVCPDGREVLHARADIVLATTLPAAPAVNAIPSLNAYAMTPQEAYQQGLLFHGPALQGIETIEGCGEQGIIGSVRAAPPATAWLRQPLRQHWLTDPLVIDGSFQMMVLWTQEQRGARSLPCHVRRYRQYRRGFPPEGTRVVVVVERSSELHALANIDYVDGEGRLISRLEGYECVIDASLERAFQRNVVGAV